MRLRSYQQEAVETCLGWHNKGTKSLCLVMPTGGGKTVTASHLALEIAQLRDGPVLWLAHRRELIKQAVKSLRKYGVQPSIIAPWATRDLSARVQVGSIQTVRLLDELPDAAVVVWDECFPAGTLVGGKPIETYSIGDSVVAFDHSRNELVVSKVSHVFKNTVKSLVRVRTSVGSIVCTPSHPVFTRNRGYVAASSLLYSDEVIHVCDPDLLHLREGVRPKTQKLQEHYPILLQRMPQDRFEKQEGCYGCSPGLFCMRERVCAKAFKLQELDPVLFCRMPRPSLERQTVCHYGKDQSDLRIRTNEKSESYATCRDKGEGLQETQGDRSRTETTRRQRSSHDVASSPLARTSGNRMVARARSVCNPMHGRAADQLQDRYCEPNLDDSDRSGWKYPWYSSSQASGPAQGSIPSFERVDSVEILEPGRDGTFGGLCPDGHVYNLEVERHNNYFANGILVHNCHHAEGEKWSSIAKAYAYRKAFLVGLTATPERADGKGLHPTFRRLVIAAKTSRLMREGYLVPCEVMVPPRLITDGVADIPVALWEQYAPDTRTVVFCSNVEHAKATAQEFVAQGYRAAWIEGDMSSRDRERVLRAFETGRIQILTNCQILTEGFDLPSIGTVLLARSVGSHALYLQMVGRGLRPEQGKSKMTLLDATGCTRLYGHPNLDRKYSLKGKPIELEDGGKITTRACSSCGTILQERSGQCPRCGLSISAQRPRKKVYNDRLEKMSTKQVVEFEKWFYDRALDRAMRQDMATAEAVARDKFFRRFGKMPEVQKWTSR